MTIDANSLVNFAKTTLGIPYSWGGGSPSGPGYGTDQGANTQGFDCSSLVQFIYAKFGVDIPRTTYEQINVGAQVDYQHLGTGDLVFFDQTSAGPGHVGMYIGNGQFLEAPHTGANVRISNMADYKDVFVGGRRIAALANGGQNDPSVNSTNTGPALSATSQASPILSPTDLAQSYGWAYNFLKSSNDIKGVFQQAVAGSWTANRFQAEVQKTNWWRTTSETARQTQVMKNTDPATYMANFNSNVADIQKKANEMGAYPSIAIVNQIVKDGMAFGYNDAQLTNVLAGYIKFTDKHLGGQAGLVEDQARKVAFQNGIPLTDQAIKNNAIAILKGQKSMEQFGNDLKNQAIGMFPAYADQLKAGQTMTDIAQPYVSSMAKLMEKDPNTIDVFDPLIKKALNGLSADGHPTGMTIPDFENLLRAQPAWGQTSNAQNAAMTTANGVLTNLGLVG